MMVTAAKVKLELSSPLQEAVKESPNDVEGCTDSGRTVAKRVVQQHGDCSQVGYSRGELKSTFRL
jgi:hypothetical protein